MDEVFSEAQEQTFSRGEEIPVGVSVHRIIEGYVGLYGEFEKTRRLLFVYKKGDIIPMMDGEEDSHKRSYLYVAMKRVHVHSVPRELFQAAMADPAKAQAMLAYTRGISELQFERINNLQHTQVLARLIERLLFFARRLGVQDGTKIRLDVPLSHVDIATSIGATRETVNRYMRQLETKGIITVRRQRITINSLGKLEQLLDTKGSTLKPNWTLLGAATAGVLIAWVI